MRALTTVTRFFTPKPLMSRATFFKSILPRPKPQAWASFSVGGGALDEGGNFSRPTIQVPSFSRWMLTTALLSFTSGNRIRFFQNGNQSMTKLASRLASFSDSEPPASRVFTVRRPVKGLKSTSLTSALVAPWFRSQFSIPQRIPKGVRTIVKRKKTPIVAKDQSHQRFLGAGGV